MINSKSFTLVELMVVVAVIGIVAGIVLAAAGGVQKKAARDQTRAEIKTMMVALEKYRTDQMSFPGDSNASRVMLFTNLTNYMAFKTTQVTNNQVLDPYGYPYWYRLVPAGGRSGSGATNMLEMAEVWSAGPNGKSGLTNNPPLLTDSNNFDDLGSWQ